MKVRRAEPADLSRVAAIADDSLRLAYAGLLKPKTTAAWLGAAYSPSALQRRWEDHPIYLVIDDGRTIAFADVFVEDDQLVLSALCTDPVHNRRGAATLLLDWITGLAPTLPVISDVVLGNRAAEGFYEAMGFVPGETIPVTRFGERMIERRWWLPDKRQRAKAG